MITINLKDDDRGIMIHKSVTNQMMKDCQSVSPLEVAMKEVMSDYEKKKVSMSVSKMANDELHKTETMDIRVRCCGKMDKVL